MNNPTRFKHIKRCQILLMLSLFCLNTSFAQTQTETQTEISVDFRVGNANIEQEYSNNSERLADIISSLQQIEQNNTLQIESISFCGAASPEGSFEINRRLSGERLSALEEYVRKRFNILHNTVINHNNQYIPWGYLITLVEESNLNYKQEVLDILNSDSHLTEYVGEKRIDSRVEKLKLLNNGQVWQTMINQYFKEMRNATTIIVTMKKELPPKAELEEKEEKPAPVEEEVEEKELTTIYVDTQPETKEWTQQFYLKTNAVGWAMLQSNIAAELDLSPHWSVALPVYYSAWDYFSHTVKFRTFKVQPEIRYWLREDDGFFVGAHLGLAYFNYAWDGDYRIQDKNRNTPALGGGLSVGYRLPISKNNRWKMEFSLGGGVYDLHYNKFHNQRNGYLVETVKDTYFGVDQVAVSFSYMFDFKKKKK